MITPGTASLKGATLTEQELEATYRTSNDLGPGYPQLEIPEWIRDLYLSVDIGTLALKIPPVWNPENQQTADTSLRNAVADFLQIGGMYRESIRCTFTGSVALNRALTAVINLARSRNAGGVDVITTSPSIDIMRLFLSEHVEVSQHYIENRQSPDSFDLDVDKVVSKICGSAKCQNQRLKLVLLTSPENPTGYFWRNDQLSIISDACARTNSVLLLDHCFLLAGIHDTPIPRIWEIAPEMLDWIAVWDTGKTFGFNEDKLGFICTGGPTIGKHLDQALKVIQFGVARRLKIFFTELLRNPLAAAYVGDLRAKCRQNLEYVNSNISGGSIRIIAPPAGSLVLLDCSSLGHTDEELRRFLLENDIGVIAGRVFFHGNSSHYQYLRIALAREPDHFRRAFDRLLEVILSL